MMPLLFSFSFLSFFLFFLIIMYFPNHPCVARKSLLMIPYSALPVNKAIEELYSSSDLPRVENGPKEVISNFQKVNRIEDFHMEKNDEKGKISGSEMIGSESSPSSLPHSRLLKATKTEGARRSASNGIPVAYQTGNKNLYRDIIEMDYDPPHRNAPIHN